MDLREYICAMKYIIFAQVWCNKTYPGVLWAQADSSQFNCERIECFVTAK